MMPMTGEKDDSLAVVDGRRGPFERTTEEFQRALGLAPGERYVMRLYIAGNSLRSRLAIENIRGVCDRYLCGRCDLEVVDLYQDVTRGRDDAVIAAPTLVKYSPLPRSRIIGDMTQADKVLAGLGLVLRSSKNGGAKV